MTDDLNVTQAFQRQLTLDLVPCEFGTKAIDLQGLNPSSPEGQEIEHIMSHARMEKVIPLAQMISVYATNVAEIRTKLFLANTPEGAIPEDVKPQIYQSQIIKIAEETAAIIANMMDAGLLMYGEVFRGAQNGI